MIHVAFGASAAIGGTVSVPIHLDAVLSEASLTVDRIAVVEAGASSSTTWSTDARAGASFTSPSGRLSPER